MIDAANAAGLDLADAGQTQTDGSGPNPVDGRPSDSGHSRCSAFQGHRLIARGGLDDVLSAVRAAQEVDPDGRSLVFDDATGSVVDLYPRQLQPQEADAASSVQPAATVGGVSTGARPVGTPVGAQSNAVKGARPPGRPRLGVVAREVTLLPRHWEWLNRQPGGASVALRRLVDEARKSHDGRDRVRQAQEVTYRFLLAIGADLPGYEEALRALFAGSGERFRDLLAAWPADVRDHALRLAAEAFPIAVQPPGQPRIC